MSTRFLATAIHIPSGDHAGDEASSAGAAPGHLVKDKLENELHDVVCSGEMRLRTFQRQIARDWQALYKRVFGVTPA